MEYSAAITELHNIRPQNGIIPQKRAEALDMAISALQALEEMEKRGITQETILEYAKFEDECVKKGFSFSSLLAAREKQIPKKPINDEYGHACCPNCNWIVYQDEFGGRCLPHCENCGQAVDWSE